MKPKSKKQETLISEDHKGIKITTPRFVISYPTLVTPRQYKGKGEAYYSIEMLFKKDDPKLKEFKKKINLAAVDAFGDNKKAWPEITWPVYDGDEKENSIGYEGCDYLRAKTIKKPVMLNRDKSVLENPEDIYGGAICDAVVVAKTVESGGDYFVTLYLQAVRFIEDGTRFGGGVDVDKDFEDLEDDDSISSDDSNDDDDLGF